VKEHKNSEVQKSTPIVYRGDEEMIKAGEGGIPERRGKRTHGVMGKTAARARRQELAQQMMKFNTFMQVEYARYTSDASSILPHLKAFNAQIKRPKPSKLIIQAAREAVKEAVTNVVNCLESIHTFKTAVAKSGASGTELSNTYSSVGLGTDITTAEKIMENMKTILTRKLRTRSTALVKIETWEKLHLK
jgi:hypothetical protein